MLVIDGISFDSVTISELKNTFEQLDSKESGRTQSGVMFRDLIGTYHNYSLTVSRGNATISKWDSLWDLLSKPQAFHTIAVPYNQGTLTFQAYVTSGERALPKVRNSQNYWGDITLNFIAKAPQQRPGGTVQGLS